MTKKIIASLLTIFFLVVITLPTVLVFLEDSSDITELFSDAEEEENKNEKELEMEAFFSNVETDVALFSLKIQNQISYCFIKYDTPYANIVSPPPELYCS